ncbi:MAG: DegQ family serine endoprotease [Hyphomicrobiales bacterium]|nr:DegQ family serine endoprotease [Hyphomicrobiales bacterium]
MKPSDVASFSLTALTAFFVTASLLCTPFVSHAQDGRTLQPRAVPENRGQLIYSYSTVVKRAAPAVVNVYVRSATRRPRRRSPFVDDPFFRRFFGDNFGRSRPRLQNSLGSGVIVSPDGIVVTNHHVVKSENSSETQIKVALADSREFEAKIILSDERTDLAVLQIEGAGKEFPYIPFANSDALEVGDIVLAIGNPFGVGQTVTSGIVSALARTRVGISDFQFFIQTDAAINPGNSGGPLVDMNGQIVGINTAIYSRSGGSNGIGFSIPSNMVRVVVNSALRGGKVERPWLGAELQTVTSDIANAIGLEKALGAIVVAVVPGSPAETAGLREGDIIVEVDGKVARDAQSVLYRLTTKGIGADANLILIRDGRKFRAALALVAAPETVPRNITEITGANPFLGASVGNLSPALAEEMSIEEVSGVVVFETDAGSTARRVGFRPGDIVLRINEVEVTRVEEMVAALDRPARGWEIVIERGGEELQTYIRR